MMNTLLFKAGTLLFLGSSTVAAFVYSGLCPTGQSCTNQAACPNKAKMVAASTMAATAEPAVMNGHCAKQKAALAAAQECQKAKKVAHGPCPYSKTDTQVAQNTEQPTEASQN